jgi:hypothetical protein
MDLRSVAEFDLHSKAQSEKNDSYASLLESGPPQYTKESGFPGDIPVISLCERIYKWNDEKAILSW